MRIRGSLFLALRWPRSLAASTPASRRRGRHGDGRGAVRGDAVRARPRRDDGDRRRRRHADGADADRRPPAGRLGRLRAAAVRACACRRRVDRRVAARLAGRRQRRRRRRRRRRRSSRRRCAGERPPGRRCAGTRPRCSAGAPRRCRPRRPTSAARPGRWRRRSWGSRRPRRSSLRIASRFHVVGDDGVAGRHRRRRRPADDPARRPRPGRRGAGRAERAGAEGGARDARAGRRQAARPRAAAKTPACIAATRRLRTIAGPRQEAGGDRSRARHRSPPHSCTERAAAPASSTFDGTDAEAPCLRARVATTRTLSGSPPGRRS